MSHYTCSSCSTPHELFGSSTNFLKAAADLQLPVLGRSIWAMGMEIRSLMSQGQLPLVPQVSGGGDAGRPVMVQSDQEGEEVRRVMREVGSSMWEWLATRPISPVGVRG